MSSTDRQNRLLLAEDWKRVYQSFRNADFKSYDFDNLRRTMINYLRENYPEDYNDYIESSEYLALIDMISFLGQNIAFRIDLNARENYLELAERRESVLRLARLLSYNPKRNIAANGLLKIEGISTTEEVVDSNSINLINQTILWNDPSNPDWYEQFVRIMNAALPVNGSFGRPVKKEIINGVPTEQYRFNSTNTEVPAYSFNKTVDGKTVPFEVVSTDITDTSVVEEAPFPGNNFAFLYRDDGRGVASSNTGFFCHFRQGILDQGLFNVGNPSTNQVVAIDAKNINQSDVWLYSLDSLGNEQELWSKVDAVEGNNVIYNSLNKNIRNIYSVLTRIEDRISLIFSDGVFGNLPQGNFRVYYRTSKNQRLVVTPDNMRGIAVRIPYVSKAGKAETITITLELQYTVDNATVSETNASIKKNAPSTYYTQNRMVTGEDYQLGPLTVSQEIVKAKSVNRISSGISRYFDLIDATGKYSTTNLFGTDGAIYKDFITLKSSFTFENLTDIEGVIVNTVEPILGSVKLRNYYYDKFPRLLVEDLGASWTLITSDANQFTGRLTNTTGVQVKVGTFTGSNMKYVKLNSLLRFVPPTGFHFLNGKLEPGSPDYRGGSNYKWVKVVSVVRDGTDIQDNGTGPIVLNDSIPTGSKLVEIRTALPSVLTADVQAQVTDQVFAYKTFGLRYSQADSEWRIITENNLDASSVYSTGKTGNTTNQQLDASWLLKFTTDGEKYTITSRAMRFVFESDTEIRFYYDSSDKIYNNKTGKIVKDKINVLNINKQPDSVFPFNYDFVWEIVEEYRDAVGYVDSKKIQVSFFDDDDDGVVDNPELFTELVNETANPTEKLVFLKKYTTSDGVEDFKYVTRSSLNIIVLSKKESIGALSQYANGQLFYYLQEDIFETLNLVTSKLTITSEYKAKIGRDGFKFQYLHAADQNSRIDPSASNIIDTYLLTRGYDAQYRQWLDGTVSAKPLPPSSDSLYTSYATELNKIKSLSDEVIYHPVKYKVLFGEKAKDDLQAKFKIVKNPSLVINDNKLKSDVISAINRFFALENWDFGDVFYFSELSSYVMNQLSPNLVTFVVVPVQEGQSFGSLYEVKSESDEIFISGATVVDIDIIDAITASRLKATGEVVTSSTTSNIGVQSGTYTSSTNGGLSY
tara:strand:- start:35876 stop:39325 length:3450 start_codon:yes stop_codon:yes gene_type:complete